MSFLKLEIKQPNGQYKALQLNQNYTGTITQQNAVLRLQKQVVKGNDGRKINVELTNYNNKILNYPLIPKIGVQKWEAVLYTGNETQCGELLLQNADCDKAVVQFNNNEQIFKELLENENLQDCVTECIFFQCLNCSYYLEIPQATFPNSSITINGTTYSDGNADLYIRVTNIALAINADYPGLNPLVEATPSPPIFATSPALLHIEIRICNQQDYDFSLNAVTDIIGFRLSEKRFSDEANTNTNLQTYMNTVVNGNIEDYPVAFFPVFNPCLFNDQQPDEGFQTDTTYQQYINYYNNGSFVITNASAHPVIPFVRVQYIFNIIEQKTGFTFKGDLINDPCFKHLTLYNNFIESRLSGYPEDNTQTYKHPIWFKLKNHVPNIDIIPWLTCTLQRLGYKFTINENIRCINISKFSQFNKTPIQMPEGIVCNKPLIKPPTTIGYTIKHADPENDKYPEQATTPTVADYVIGDGETEIQYDYYTTNHFVGPNLANDPDNAEYNWIVPQIWNVANTTIFNIGENDYTPTLMLYCGFTQASDGTTLYPFGSNNGLNFNGDTVCDCSLDFADTNSFFQRNTLPLLKLLNNAIPVEIEYLPTKDFNPLQFTDLTLTCVFFYHNQYQAIWQKTSVQYNQYQIIRAKTTFLLLL